MKKLAIILSPVSEKHVLKMKLGNRQREVNFVGNLNVQSGREK